ncbi:formimidoylglutamase [Chryseobacterium sp. A301]
MGNYKTFWNGRNDGDNPLAKRLFQAVDFTLPKNSTGYALVGFEVDEGVLRNQGRVGARHAPNTIRTALANFPVTSHSLLLHDLGNIDCEDGDLEKAQARLSERVAQILRTGSKSIVLGGGHEITLGHFNGIRSAFPDKKIGILNLDAHFDNRQPASNGLGSSGTGFWQIAQKEPLHSLHIGIQRNSNTLALFDTAHTLGMQYILAEELYFENLPALKERIVQFTSEADILYLTICMDVFNAAIAPGVSALAYNGIFAEVCVMSILREILSSNKLVSMDVAEVNPTYDPDHRTSRLAASLVNEWFLATS